MNNNNYYSEVEKSCLNKKNNCSKNHFNACEDNEDSFDNNIDVVEYNDVIECNKSNHHDRDDDKDRNRDREKCCGKRFNNRNNNEKIQGALKVFENQLNNTDAAIDCLNKLFNNLEDDLFEDRCCLSNRIKNIIQSIQTKICDLDDDITSIRDDFECLEQAL